MKSNDRFSGVQSAMDLMKTGDGGQDGGDEIVLDPERFEVVCQRAVGVTAVVAVPIGDVVKQGEVVPIAYRRERINVRIFAPNKLKLIKERSGLVR